MKSKKVYAGAAAVCGLVFMVLLSGTVYNFNRPVVTAAMPARGHLNHREVVSGVARFGASLEVYADVAAWVSIVHVREGDAVVVGQPLFTLDFRAGPRERQDEIEQLEAQIENATAQFYEQLESLRIDRLRNQIELERIDGEIQSIHQQINETRGEELGADNSLDFEIRQNREDAQQAAERIRQNEILFAAGAISLQELLDSQSSMEGLLRRGELLAQQQAGRFYDWERGRLSRLEDLEHQLAIRERERRARRLDAEAFSGREAAARRDFANRVADYERRIAESERRLAAYDETLILSQGEGAVTNIFVNQGQHIAANQHLASIGLGAHLVVETELSLGNNFVTVGSAAQLRNASQSIGGTVAHIVPFGRYVGSIMSLMSTFTVTKQWTDFLVGRMPYRESLCQNI